MELIHTTTVHVEDPDMRNKGGLSSCIYNEKFRTARNANNIARVKATVKRQLNCGRGSRKHINVNQQG